MDLNFREQIAALSEENGKLRARIAELEHPDRSDLAKKQAERELHETKKRLELTYQMVDSGAWEWDLVTQENIWSQGIWNLYGLDPNSCRPSYQSWLLTVHPEDRERCENILNVAVAHRSALELEWRVEGSGEPERWLWSRGYPLTDGAFTVRRYCGIVLDVTKRKNDEEQLRKTNTALAIELDARQENEGKIRSLTARLMRVQEEERERLARDLHDDLTQQIAAVGINLGTLTRYIPEDQLAGREQSEQLYRKVVALSDSVRRIAHELHPALFEHSGLADALGSYCGEFEKMNGVRVTCSISGCFEDLETDVALHLFRIIQESLKNVVKHANVNSAMVKLERTARRLQVVISDEGLGFEPSRKTKVTGLGLVSIQERARLAGGMVEIKSAPGEGTTIIVTINTGVDR